MLDFIKTVITNFVAKIIELHNSNNNKHKNTHTRVYIYTHTHIYPKVFPHPPSLAFEPVTYNVNIVTI